MFRITLGLLILLIGLLLEQPWGVLGWIPVITGTIGWCPLYAGLGCSSKESFHWTRGKNYLTSEGS